MIREEAIRILASSCIPGSKQTEALETLIPELRESEDERVRKELVEKITNLACGCFISQEQKQRFIHYLERKKEHEEGDRTYEAKIYWKGRSDAMKQKEQKPINESNMHEPTLDEARKWNEAYEKGYSLGYENGRNEQNPAWGEEDDQLIGFIFDLLNDLVWRKDWAMSKEECLERLKSLRLLGPNE